MIHNALLLVIATALSTSFTTNFDAVNEAQDLASTAHWTCAAERWASPPVLKDGVFQSELVSRCAIYGGMGKVSALFERLVKTATADVTVHKGPFPAAYKGLPAIGVDVTVKGDPKDDVKIRQDVLIASDSTTRLVYAMRSKHIKASGMAGYLKEIATEVDLSTDQTLQARYTFVFYNRIRVERPWYAPSFIFKAKAESIAREKYLEARSAVVADFTRDL